MKQIIIFFCLIISSTISYAVLIDGIEFPDGEASFADEVVSYAPGSDVGGIYIDPESALGVPDWSSETDIGIVSLGDGGELILRFTNNFLTTSGNSDTDLWIFEVGNSIEKFNVAISIDGIDWIDVGDVVGSVSGVDIDAISEVVAGELYSYVRLLDIAPNQSGFPFGEADIDAVGAISTVINDLIFKDNFDTP